MTEPIGQGEDKKLPVVVETTRRLRINRTSLLNLLQTAGIIVPADAQVTLPPAEDDEVGVGCQDTEDWYIEVSYQVATDDSVNVGPRTRGPRKPKPAEGSLNGV